MPKCKQCGYFIEGDNEYFNYCTREECPESGGVRVGGGWVMDKDKTGCKW